MTTIASVLKSTGQYSTSFVGKWDVGMATDAHTPFNRGYDKFLGYFHHSNDYWSHAEQKCYMKEVRVCESDDQRRTRELRIPRRGAARSCQGCAHLLIRRTTATSKAKNTS